jgi:hypothetical protein
MDARRTLLLATILLVAVVGCRGLAPPPLFQPPGSAQYQRARAERFDPYPENEPGPAIVGARPLEYQDPPAEVRRSRWHP